jgi:hypothetical protein
MRGLLSHTNAIPPKPGKSGSIAESPIKYFFSVRNSAYLPALLTSTTSCIIGWFSMNEASAWNMQVVIWFYVQLRREAISSTVWFAKSS